MLLQMDFFLTGHINIQLVLLTMPIIARTSVAFLMCRVPISQFNRASDIIPALWL